MLTDLMTSLSGEPVLAFMDAVGVGSGVEVGVWEGAGVGVRVEAVGTVASCMSLGASVASVPGPGVAIGLGIVVGDDVGGMGVTGIGSTVNWSSGVSGKTCGAPSSIAHGVNSALKYVTALLVAASSTPL